MIALRVPLFAAALLSLAACPLTAQASGGAENPCAGRDVNALYRASVQNPRGVANDPCARWLAAERQHLRREIVAAQHGGVDPCPGVEPEAALASFVEMPAGCDRLGEELIRRVQALANAASREPAQPGTGSRPPPDSRGPGVLGGDGRSAAGAGASTARSAPPLSDDAVETAIQEALAGRDVSTASIRGTFGSLGTAESRDAARWESTRVGDRLLDLLIARVPGGAFERGNLAEVYEQNAAAIREVQVIAMLGALQGADGKPVFRTMKAMIPVAARLAETASKDPHAMLALKRMKAMLLRMDLAALAERNGGQAVLP